MKNVVRTAFGCEQLSFIEQTINVTLSDIQEKDKLIMYKNWNTFSTNKYSKLIAFLPM